MKCLKNPRYKHRNKAEYLGRAMEINTEHIAFLLRTCRKLWPKTFSKKICAEYIMDYMDTVKEFNEYGEADIKEYEIAKYLKDMPYVTWDTARMIYARLRSRTMNRLDAALYDEPTFIDSFTENILLMMIQLHYSNGIGPTRMLKIVESWTWFDKPFEWLESELGVSFEGDSYDVYKFLEEADRAKKKRSLATLREQLDAKRSLEALKKYQDEVKS
jgi:hypothetical protein